jgi:hypothetical protein
VRFEAVTEEQTNARAQLNLSKRRELVRTEEREGRQTTTHQSKRRELWERARVPAYPYIAE